MTLCGHVDRLRGQESHVISSVITLTLVEDVLLAESQGHYFCSRTLARLTLRAYPPAGSTEMVSEAMSHTSLRPTVLRMSTTRSSCSQMPVVYTDKSWCVSYYLRGTFQKQSLRVLYLSQRISSVHLH